MTTPSEKTSLAAVARPVSANSGAMNSGVPSPPGMAVAPAVVSTLAEPKSASFTSAGAPSSGSACAESSTLSSLMSEWITRQPWAKATAVASCAHTRSFPRTDQLDAAGEGLLPLLGPRGQGLHSVQGPTAPVAARRFVVGVYG